MESVTKSGQLAGAGGGENSLIIREVPTGTIDGTNAVFTLSEVPISGTEQVFLDGQLQNVGAANDYTISGAVITFVTAPSVGSILLVNYNLANVTYGNALSLQGKVTETVLTPSSHDYIPTSKGTADFIDSKLSTYTIIQDGDNRTLELTDAGKLLLMTSGSANTVTVPLNSSVAFPTGTKIDIIQTGTGTTSIAATSGVTILKAESLNLKKQYAAVSLIKTGTDQWVLIGNLAAP